MKATGDVIVTLNPNQFKLDINIDYWRIIMSYEITIYELIKCQI